MNKMGNLNLKNYLSIVGCLALFASLPSCNQAPNNKVNKNTHPLSYHGAYWVANIKVPEKPIKMEIINDMHIDTMSKRVTVYAQSRILGKTVSPPQVNPGECIDSRNGKVCFHPNAVYLNGTGKELTQADGTGDWWIKHSWILDGEGYRNWELPPLEDYGEGEWVEGNLLEDGLTMKVGVSDETKSGFFNLRKPVFDKNEISYQVIRYEPKNLDIKTGPIDKTPTIRFTIDFKCKEAKSAFNKIVRICPQK